MKTTMTQFLVEWLPLVTATTLATVAAASLPDWARMWLIAISLYGGFKWLTWQRTRRRHSPTFLQSLAYLVLYPGMNAVRFLAGTKAERPSSGDWLRALRNVIAGAALVWLVAAWFTSWRPWTTAWIGMVGIVLVLHFGVFDVMALAWQRAGVDAVPIMQRPATASSLADFWGKRWNTAFRDLAYQVVYQPLARRFGTRGAMAAVFVFSGLLHDLVISVPARAGYGLPTFYFILQAIGVEIERSAAGRRWRLRGGVRGWAYAAMFVLAPVKLLFHPAFLRHVVIPFLNVIGGYS
jgi:alginate O-acetyltransferase complex protein AlgI